MKTFDPIELMFGGMDKLGPGSDAETRAVLNLLPPTRFRTVIDAGCGTGRQTMVLASQLQTTIHAVDNYAPFLSHLNRRAADAGLEHLVKTHCIDMAEIPAVFPEIDLLWSEGAAYSIGFSNALGRWKTALVPVGLLVVSELSWTSEHPPQKVRAFFDSEYPDMKSIQGNIDTIEKAGYRLLATHSVPPEAWVDGYYDLLEPRARRLLEHEGREIRAFAAGILEEIEVFKTSEGSYGYVFFVLKCS